MGVRKSAWESSATDLARRRLSQLGAELSATAPAPSSATALEQGSGEHGSGEHGPREHGPRENEPRARPGRHARERLPVGRRLLARAADALPPSMHGHLGVTSHHVTVVALVLSAAMALAAWLVIRSNPDPVSVPQQASIRLPAADAATPPAVGQGLPTPPTTELSAVATAGDDPVAAAAAELVVHVTGKVRHAGIVELPGGARVIDAIEAAGGARRHVDLGMLNLARPVVDGEQIAVGVSGTAVAPAPTTAVASGVPTAPVNLNTATQLQLEELPGVGPVTATSIIEWRTEHGGFSTVEELIEVSGIGEVTLSELRDLVTV